MSSISSSNSYSTPESLLSFSFEEFVSRFDFLLGNAGIICSPDEERELKIIIGYAQSKLSIRQYIHVRYTNKLNYIRQKCRMTEKMLYIVTGEIQRVFSQIKAHEIKQYYRIIRKEEHLIGFFNGN